MKKVKVTDKVWYKRIQYLEAENKKLEEKVLFYQNLGIENLESIGTIRVPRELTAENGAKYLMSGEFFVNYRIDCPECYGDDTNDDCEICEGAGILCQKSVVEWTMIKDIWKKAIEHFTTETPKESN